MNTTSRRHICLINPPCPWLINDRAHHPMGLLSLAAYVRERGFSVEILDLASVAEDRFEFPAADVYGLTAVTAQMPIVARIAERLSAERPDGLRVIGGIHATVLPEETLEKTDFQVAVVGEGERTLEELASEKPLERIAGIVYRDRDGVIRSNRVRELIRDLDELPFPAFDLIDVESYKPAGIIHGMTLMTARGCPFECLFCAAVPRSRRRYRQQSIDRVCREIEYLHNRYGTRFISIQDELFTLKKPRFLEACERFSRLGIAWRFMTRSDAIDREMIRGAVRGGCVQMCLGIESGSQKVLDSLNKKTTVADNARALDLAREEGLKTMAYLISASPGEDDSTVNETIEFLKVHPADEYGLMLFTPFPGTGVWKEPHRYDFELPDDYSRYQYLNRDGTGVSLHRDKQRALSLHQKLFDFVKGSSSFVRKERMIV